MEVRLTTTKGTRFLTNPLDTYVGKSIEIYGEWSHGEIVALGVLLKPDSNVVEVGSNIGAHTVFIARDICPHGKVFAFEPRRLIFQMLCANIALNGIANVHAHELALGSREQTITEGRFPVAENVNAGAFAIGSIAGDEETIAMRTLDSFAPKLPRIDLIKADVEGFELEVLRGAEALIRRDRPILYLENDRPELSRNLLQHVAELGYDIWWHVIPLFRPDNLACTMANVFGDVASFNILCAPRERDYAINGLQKVADFDEHPLRLTPI